jgi:hypothetical protein
MKNKTIIITALLALLLPLGCGESGGDGGTVKPQEKPAEKPADKPAEKVASGKPSQNSIVSYVRVSGKQAMFFIENTGKTDVRILQDFKHPYFTDNAGKIALIDSVAGNDITKPVSDKIAQGVMNGKIDFDLAGRDFIILIFEAK